MKYRLILFVRHLVNAIFAPLFVFCTRANYFSGVKYYPAYPDMSLTAEVTLPGTPFAEVVVKKDGYRPIRYQVGRIDAGTEVLAITTGDISFRVSGKEWSTAITQFAVGLHFCKA